MNNIINDYVSQVHDNQILSYKVDFENEILDMDTIWEKKERTTIRFTGLLAHEFEGVITSNIIYGIYQPTLQSFVDENREVLSNEIKQYGFPSLRSRNCEELISMLSENCYNIYQIDSSLGLCGYVIAKEISINILKI